MVSSGVRGTQWPQICLPSFMRKKNHAGAEVNWINKWDLESQAYKKYTICWVFKAFSVQLFLHVFWNLTNCCAIPQKVYKGKTKTKENEKKIERGKGKRRNIQYYLKGRFTLYTAGLTNKARINPVAARALGEMDLCWSFIERNLRAVKIAEVKSETVESAGSFHFLGILLSNHLEDLIFCLTVFLLISKFVFKITPMGRTHLTFPLCVECPKHWSWIEECHIARRC